MFTVLCSLIRILLSAHRGGRELALENLALRQQLAVMKRQCPRPRLRSASRKANGEDIKTIQELLRHANYKVTADVCTQAITKAKREAQRRVVRLILPDEAAKEVG